MTEQDNERELTDEQAANMPGVSRRTVHRYGESGTIQTRKGCLVLVAISLHPILQG